MTSFAGTTSARPGCVAFDAQFRDEAGKRLSDFMRQERCKRQTIERQ